MKSLFFSLAALIASAVVGAEIRPEDRPIGVFDSGIGGLSVLEPLLTLDEFDNVSGEMHPDGRPDFADEDFVYFGDQANMPYGRYAAEGKTDFLRELIRDDARFVLGTDRHLPSKIVVIACNTATAYGMDTVRELSRAKDVETIGVVDAGVEATLDALKWVRTPYAIAVMATPGTVASGVYERTIRQKLKERISDVPVEIVSRGGIGLAEAVESRDPGMRECARTNLVALVDSYRARKGKAPIRALILGCTHYPYVLGTFHQTFLRLKADPKYAPLIADDLKFIDPAHYTAIACYKTLRGNQLLSEDGPTRKGERRVNAFMSVGKDGPLADAVKYGRTYGTGDLGTKIVPFAKGVITPDVAAGIRKTCPACYRELGL